MDRTPSSEWEEFLAGIPERAAARARRLQELEAQGFLPKAEPSSPARRHATLVGGAPDFDRIYRSTIQA